ncbi:hydantoinase/oxoprolinase family protein [Thermopolyspora sp. NPDC052614]|uniref:hydantoinase/oxoprolinase family protein n=1 Tax=Thermopolyspora sp. NPDC052614 TaxID=3155682 RepID=UPI0034343A2C
MPSPHVPEICYIDVGGTFTDAFIVDGEGGYATGKAPSTHGDIARGFFAAIDAAARQWDMSADEVLPHLKVLGYGSTAVLNAILTRSGRTPGLITTRGFEAILLMERGKQTWLDLDRASRLHPVTHRHNEPIVPRRLIRGVTGRIDGRGREVIPLREQEARSAAGELLDAGVDAICVALLWSFLDDRHERRVAEIVAEEANARGRTVRVVCSVDVAPVIRELPRVNATILEAYTGDIARNAFGGMQERLRERGFRGRLQIMQSTGGLAPATHVKAVETIQSGPAGGVIGARYLGQVYGFDNVITSDVGGTSFDVGMVTEGYINVNREPSVARMLVGLPMIEILSIGAGGGTIASIDPLTGRLEIGPASAGSEPGPACFGRGGTRPTVTDADLVLGYLNPANFAGGSLPLDVEAARTAIRTQVAEPLGMSVEEAAEGIRVVADAKMRDAIAGLIATRGLDLSEYHLLAFGGAGPSHVAGYTDGLNLAGVLVLPFSPVFSAFGASSADYEHHYNRTVNVVVSPDPDEREIEALGRTLGDAWRELGEQALDQMAREGFERARVRFRPLAMLRYGRQLNELVVESPVTDIRARADWNLLIGAFEDIYERVYAVAAKYPQAGYEVLEVGLVAYVEKIRPKLRAEALAGPDPAPGARRATRRGYFGGWTDMPVWDLAGLRPGNELHGPCVVEDATLTVVVPPGRYVRLDQYSTLWMEKER